MAVSIRAMTRPRTRTARAAGSRSVANSIRGRLSSELCRLRNLVDCNKPFKFINGNTASVELRQCRMHFRTEAVRHVMAHRDRTDTLSEPWKNKDGKAPLMSLEKITWET